MAPLALLQTPKGCQRVSCTHGLSSTKTLPRPYRQSIFDANVSVTDGPGNERNITASELGLTTRFFKHACDAVNKAFSVSKLPNIMFGDMQGVGNHGPTPPDIMV